MNINEFARYCGVSPATISRYFSGNAPMSPELSEKIDKAVQETGYRPSPKYQRRKSGGTGVVVAIISHWQHRFQWDILEELHKYCEALRKRLVVLYGTAGNMSECIPTLRSLSPEGIVLLHEGSDKNLYEALPSCRIPTVVCTGMSLTRRAWSVHIDDIAAAYDGANYLLKCGHVNLGVVSDEAQAISSGSQRIMGCRKALEDAGLILPEENIVYAGNSFIDGYRGMQELLGRKTKLTAVFAFNDEMAAGCIAALNDCGLRVPEDISILGFDNSSQAEETRPRLASVGQPLEQIVRRSLDVILTAHAKEEVESITFGHTIVEGASCRDITGKR